jgi:phosphoribosyl 1,2-cyclic phosphodiesterase
MRIYVLASGSDGNATVFESNGSRVLVDGGIGPQALVQRLVDLRAGGMPDAILVTHAHQDHVGQTSRIAKKLRIPVYALESTAKVARLGDRSRVRLFAPDEPFEVGGLLIEPLGIPHDADQVAFRVSDGVRRAGIATDLGEVTADLVDHFRSCDAVLVESNHDLGMLRTGPYPSFLKRRVESGRGHLSNEQAHDLLRRLSFPTRVVVLMHLSRTNNTPELALEIARDALSGRRVRLLAAEPKTPFVIDVTDERPGVPFPRRAAKRTPRTVPSEQLSLF